MMLTVRIVALLHLAVYVGIIWYGWQSYRLLRKKSWRYMGIGFTILLVYRIRQVVKQLMADYVIDAENTLLPFVGAVFLLVAFRMLASEHSHLLSLMMVKPGALNAGAQPVEYWLNNFRVIVREEVSNALSSLKLKTTMKE